MFRTNLRWIAPALILALGVAGCDEGEPTTPDTPETSLTVLLTDAPGDVAAVWVEIVEMYLQGAEGREPLPYVSEGLINLTDLFGIAMPLVEGASVESGPYEQLRIVVGEAVLLSENNDWYALGQPAMPDPPGEPGEYDPYEAGDPLGELHCPSCSQSGIKVKLAGDHVELPEGEAVMVLDFNVAESFGHAAGRSGKWVMHPVIHAVIEEGSMAPAGSIEGTVVLGTAPTPTQCAEGVTWDVDDFVPMATATTLLDGDDQPIVRFGATEGGAFGIGPLESDLYTLGFQVEIALTDWVLQFTEVDLQPEAQADVQGDVVGGFVYTINDWTCIPVL